MKYFLFILMLFVNALSIGQSVTYNKVPDWVVPIEAIPSIEFSTNNAASDGYTYSLINRQINLDEDIFFYHNVVNVVSYGGITNASQLMVNYDSSYQKVVVHHLNIWRKGKKIERTGELTFEILRTETNLSNGIYYGHCQAYDILNDVRKDDIIDFAFSIVGENPIFGDLEHQSVTLQDMKPIDRIFIRLIKNGNRELKYKCDNCDSIEVISFAEGSTKIIQVAGNNIKEAAIEDNMPPWTNPFANLMVTEFNSWNEVNLWAQDVFKLDAAPVLDEVYTEILTGNESTDEKINKFINFVQDEIRYMGDESGIGNMKPRNPEKVIKQRYGDCKDKSLLLVSLLKQSGIEKAWPVMVNTALQHTTQDYLPGNRLFNHCIVKFEYHDSVFWVDPTVFLQGGNFRTHYTEDYGRVLVIGQPADTLQIMNPRKPESSYNLTYVFDSPAFDQPVTVTCTSVRKGQDADIRRVMNEMIPMQEVTKSFLEEMRSIFPSIEFTSDAEFIDDPDKNELKIIHHMKINEFWLDGDKSSGNPGIYSFAFQPVEIQQMLMPNQFNERKHDVYFENFNIKCNYIFNCPREIQYLDAWDSFDSDAFKYEEIFTQTGPNTVMAEYSLINKCKSLKPEQFTKLNEQKKKIVEGLRFALIFSKQN